MAEDLGFTFAGRTIDYFGDKSITSDITAMFELVKNSRDANANNITIHFKGLNSSGPEIEIRDDGDGMSADDIRKKWMVIGTNSRLEHQKTNSGKPVWGEMGIGRMACQKLGSMTKLISVKNNQMIQMTFDWLLFEKPNITVDKIKFPIEIGSAKHGDRGTRLEITDLKSEWSSRTINSFKDELSLLISDDTFDDARITVLVGDGAEEIIGKNYAKLRKRVTENAPFTLKAKFDGNNLDVSILTRVGRKASWEKFDIPNQPDGMQAGPFTMNIYHFPRAPGKEKKSTLETYYKNRIGVEQLENFLDHNHGLYVYRDGVWMKPYGGSNDWLSMEAGARQETSKIGIKQIYGQINLSKKYNPGIKPASHRETLIDNDAFKALKNITKIIFDNLGTYMKDWKKKEREKMITDMGGNKGLKDPGLKIREILKTMEGIATTVPARHKAQYKLCLSGIDRLVAEQKREAHEKLVDIGETIDYEKRLATLGIATSFMARHMAEPLEDNMQLVEEGEKMRERIMKKGWTLLEKDQKRTRVMLDDMKENQAKMLHFMKFVNVLARHIAQSIRRKNKHTQVDIMECWKTVLDGFQDRTKELNIKINNDHSNRHNKNAKEKLVVKIDRIDLECILTNFYLNSVESLKTIKGTRWIKFHYWYHANFLHIEFSDNGRGIPKSKLEEVFEPFKFGHSSDNGEMHGQGLGLYIVKEIIRDYEGGKVEALDVKHGAKLKLLFPVKKVVS